MSWVNVGHAGRHAVRAADSEGDNDDVVMI